MDFRVKRIPPTQIIVPMKVIDGGEQRQTLLGWRESGPLLFTSGSSPVSKMRLETDLMKMSLRIIFFKSPNFLRMLRPFWR